MKKFVKELTILAALIFAPLSLTCFNKPTFAMESNSNTQINVDSKFTKAKFAELNAELQEAMNELQTAYINKNNPQKKQAMKKIQKINEQLKNPNLTH